MHVKINYGVNGIVLLGYRHDRYLFSELDIINNMHKQGNTIFVAVCAIITGIPVGFLHTIMHDRYSLDRRGVSPKDLP